MELAIAIQSPYELELLKDPWMTTNYSQVEQETIDHIQKALQDKLGQMMPQRLYYGSEFCQYRLPKGKDLLKAYQMAQEANLAFTFATPYVPQAGLLKLTDLLDQLHEVAATERKENDALDKIEVVVNDWGVLHLIKRKYPFFSPVVGRLLNKMIRDPRVAHLYDQEGAPEKAKQALQQASHTVPYFQRFLEGAGVKRVEFDNTIQGIDMELDSFQLNASLHLGYGTVATGRSCLVGTLHKPKEEKFKGEVVCKQQCQHYQAEMVNKREQLGALPYRVFQKGNSVFYQQTLELLEKGIEFSLAQNMSRIVYSPRIPV